MLAKQIESWLQQPSHVYTWNTSRARHALSIQPELSSKILLLFWLGVAAPIRGILASDEQRTALSKCGLNRAGIDLVPAFLAQGVGFQSRCRHSAKRSVALRSRANTFESSLRNE